ncbi:sel1 repeat family protein [Pelomyxa schiedti]|nr:sel1 repeat family protein [Pelomyxa schiedti]
MGQDQGTLKNAKGEAEAMIDNADHLFSSPECRREAVLRWVAAANLGHPTAAVNAGWCHLRGLGIERDPAAALGFFRRAADAGYADGAASAAFCQQWGIGCSPDPSKAVALYRAACEAAPASPIALVNLGWCLLRGVGVEPDPAAAAELLRRAAEMDDPAAHTALGWRHVHGGDSALALDMFRRAAEGGDECGLGWCHQVGCGLERDPAAAAAIYRRGAEEMLPAAMICLGLCYESGQGVPCSAGEAASLYSRAAAIGGPSAFTTLGVCFEQGNFVERSVERAIDLYRRGACCGDPDAIFRLARCLKNTCEGSSEALFLFSQAAAFGHKEAEKALKSYEGGVSSVPSNGFPTSLHEPENSPVLPFPGSSHKAQKQSLMINKENEALQRMREENETLKAKLKDEKAVQETLKEENETLKEKVKEESTLKEKMAEALQKMREENETLKAIVQEEAAINKKVKEENEVLTTTMKEIKEKADNSEIQRISVTGKKLQQDHCTFNRGELALLDLDRLDLNTAQLLGGGCNGCVSSAVVKPPDDNMAHSSGSERRKVALKMMFNYSAGVQTRLQKVFFEREAEVGLIHPHWCCANVCSTFRAKTQWNLIPPKIRPKYTIVNDSMIRVGGYEHGDGTPVFERTTYITMELGEYNLQSALSNALGHYGATQGQFEQPNLPQLTFCLLCACYNFNSNDWFHCDIKLDNVLAMKRPGISGLLWVLCDFGTAQHPVNGEFICPQGETFPGCEANRSPECRHPQKIPPRYLKYLLTKNDVWAIGCVIYECVCGKHPYHSGNVTDTPLLESQEPFSIPPDKRVYNPEAAAMACHLLERDTNKRPTAKQAMLVCGALMFLPPPHPANLCSTSASLFEESRAFFSSPENTPAIQSMIWEIHKDNVTALEALHSPPTVDQLSSLVFTNEVLNSPSLFVSSLCAFCESRKSSLTSP